MSDAHLRELERRWRESGSVEDEAALLRERLRGGAISPQALARAADMNHPAARLATGRPGPAPHDRELDPLPGDPCVRCWQGTLADTDPAPELGPVYDPSGDHDGVLSSYVSRCDACGERYPGRSWRHVAFDDGKVTYRRVYSAPEERAAGQAPTRPAAPGAQEPLLRRLGRWLLG